MTFTRLGRILARYPSFIGFALLQRVTVALVELAVEFGVQNIAAPCSRSYRPTNSSPTWVGASRLKVSER